jgi:hypothetical protein
MKPPHVPIDALPALPSSTSTPTVTAAPKTPMKTTALTSIDTWVLQTVRIYNKPVTAQRISSGTIHSVDDVLDSFERLVQADVLVLVPAINTTVPKNREPLRVRVKE